MLSLISPFTRQNRHTAWIVLIAGLVITAGATLYMKASVERVAERDFLSLSDEIQREISKRLDDHARILLCGSAFFQASDEVTREKWRVFTQHQQVDKQLPGIQGIGYSLLIPRSELAQHIQKIRHEGFPEYTVKPAGERDIYTSIIYLEPFSGRNLRAFGYDMFSEPVRRAAMERARDTDSPALSGRVVLVQETDKEVQAGTLMYVPLYSKGLPTDTVEQRRAAILGWVYSPYRMTDLIQGILGDRNLEREKRLHLRVFDGEQLSPQSLLYGCHPSENDGCWPAPRFTRQIPVDFNGHRWTLCFAQTYGGIFTVDDVRVWLTLIGGTLITLLLFTLIRVLLNTRAEAQRLAEELTVDLKTSEQSYRNQFANNSSVMLLTDPQDGSIIDANSAALNFYGYPRSRLLSMHIADLNTLPASEVSQHMASVELEHGKRFQFQHRLADGSMRDVEVSSSGIQFGGRTILHSIIQDITDLNKAEKALISKTALLEAQVNASLDGILVIDENQKRVLINQRMVALFNIPPHILQDEDDTALLMHVTSMTKKPEQFLEKVMFLYDHTTETSRDDIEFNSGMLLDRYSAPVLGKDGKYYGRIWAFRDITERKQMEESLRHTTERLSLAVRAGGVGIWDYDVVNNRLVWDDQMFRLYGITRELFSGAYDAWQAGVHPEDRLRGDEEIQLALKGIKDFDIEFRVLWPDGTTHHIRGFASVHRDVSGQPLRMIGTNWDITAQKRTEVALRESETNFRTFFETIDDMVTVTTREGRIRLTNKALEHKLGYRAVELVGMHVLDLHAENQREEAKIIFADMLRGTRDNCPLPLTAKDGTLIPVETRIWFGKWDGAECMFGVSKDLSMEQEAKQRFERLFRNNPNLMSLSTVTERQFTDVNDAFLKTLGYSREEIIGNTSTNIGLFVHPENQAEITDILAAEGRISNFELQIRRKDGSTFDGLFSGELINSQGQRHLLGVTTDITERKRAERELARLSVIQHELMCLATQFVNVPVERQDTAIDQSLATMGKLIHADRAYLFAYDFGQEVMSNTHEWCSPGITPEIDNLQALPTALFPDWVSAHKRGELVHIPSVAALPADSHLREVLEPQGIRSLITLPLMQESACLGFAGFDAVREERAWQEEEVSLLRVLAELYAHFETRRAMERETRDLQNRLTLARDAAQEAARAKSLFLANMSHEIRTPLNAILGYAQIMERECRNCPTGQRLNAITRSGEHLLELITDILELVRSDARMIPLAPTVFDFYQVLEDVRLMFARRPESQGLTLDVSHTLDVPQFIYADSGKIRQILVNLVGNAVKFTRKGGVRLSASVVSGGTPDSIRMAVDVEDTGCGIDKDEQERIFDVFEQAKNNLKTGKGTGLGLPLSRRYARALGGDVTLLSQSGEGSCFRLTFCARAASCDTAEQPFKGAIQRLAPGQRKCHILAVDDDPLSRDMLTAMLIPIGFTVESVDSATQALHRLESANGIDLVLIDKHMPEMDGYEAIGRIRELPNGHELPVIVVTASGFGDENKQALAAGANGHVSKPVRREQLLDEIGRLTGVQYEYEQNPTADPSAMAPAEMSPEKLSLLSPEQRCVLDQALRRGDILLLRDMTKTIAREHPGLAAGIRALLDAYNYDRLRYLLDSTKGKTV